MQETFKGYPPRPGSPLPVLPLSLQGFCRGFEELPAGGGEYSGGPFFNRAFNLRLRAACRALGVGEITAHGLRHSAATILLNQ